MDSVHGVTRASASDFRAVYVDSDPVVVAEILDLLDGAEHATAVRGDLCEPDQVLGHRLVRRLLDFTQPIGLLMCAVLHWVPDDTEAYPAVRDLVAALPSGSYLVISHAAAEVFPPGSDRFAQAVRVYQTDTGSLIAPRSHSAVAQFFTGLHLEEPGVVQADEWRPDPQHPQWAQAGSWAAVGRKTI
jgi:hypothetical protein